MVFGFVKKGAVFAGKFILGLVVGVLMAKIRKRVVKKAKQVLNKKMIPP